MLDSNDIIKMMVRRTGESEEFINKYFNAMIEIFIEELITHNEVKLIGFGRFEVVDRAQRKGYNPFYKKTTIIPACKEPVFRVGKELKEMVNEE
ncbi:MAG: HU family DNA-binding protein [Clostridia bacterium]|nr:HU family DNA-binding protein [Clostridia bacterium]